MAETRDLEQLGALLRQRRDSLDLTREELSRRVGVTPAYIWLVERAQPRRGRKLPRPSRATLKRWASALSMTDRNTSDLLTLAGYHHLDPQIDADLKPAHSPSTEEKYGSSEDHQLLIPLFETPDEGLWCFTPKEPLEVALRYMRERDFSQVVVRQSGRLTLLTVEGIAGWLRQNVGPGRTDVGKATIADALAYELPHNSAVIAGSQTVREALNAFSLDSGHPRLYALIITESGTHQEGPIGIVTPWDLLSYAD